MILLDTHAWIWWVTESARLSTKAAQAIAQANSTSFQNDIFSKVMFLFC